MISLISQKNKFSAELLDMFKTLEISGFESYLVGGCVRDILLGKKPKDWDITTSATPEEIQALFPESFYTNTFGTVGVKTETLNIVEITPFRTESTYSDGRRPDSVLFSKNIEDDLKRRDFTINALAYNPIKDKFIDLFDGIKDIRECRIKAVGVAKERFSEDGLRILRMVRFAAQLNFSIDTDTLSDAIAVKDMLACVAKERVKDEFSKILMSDHANMAFIYMKNMKILSSIAIELENSVDVGQNGCHAYDVFEHLVRSMQCAVDKHYSFEIRLAALFHDIGKPPTKQWSDLKRDYTFYGHEVVGAKIAKNILQNLHFSRETIEKVVKLIRWHMFFSDTEQITPSAVRRMIVNVGKENIWDLMNLRICDRVGTGRPKEDPYRLRKYMSIIEEVLADPTDVSMLKISGKDLIDTFNISPGPIIGKILTILLEKALVDPSINTKDMLISESSILLKMEQSELDLLFKKANMVKVLKNKEKKDDIKKKYKVS